MEISDCLSEETISLDVTGKNKPEILRNLVDLLKKTTPLFTMEKVVHLLQEREELKTTGIGSGVAIPHCKIADIDRLYIAIGLSRKGIEFQSLDNNPVHLIFLVIAPENSGSDHLKICAKIVRLFRKTKVREELLTIPTADKVIAYIREMENA